MNFTRLTNALAGIVLFLVSGINFANAGMITEEWSALITFQNNTQYELKEDENTYISWTITYDDSLFLTHSYNPDGSIETIGTNYCLNGVSGSEVNGSITTNYSCGAASILSDVQSYSMQHIFDKLNPNDPDIEKFAYESFSSHTQIRVTDSTTTAFTP